MTIEEINKKLSDKKRLLTDIYFELQEYFETKHGKDVLIFLELGSFFEIYSVDNENMKLGKAKEVTTAIAKGVEDAKKNLVKVPIFNGTIPHEQVAKFGGANVLLKPASSGTGVKAGGAMRAVLESVGVKDVLAKSKGSSNHHNLVKATIEALINLRDAYTVAEHRGVELNKVFNG